VQQGVTTGWNASVGYNIGPPGTGVQYGWTETPGNDFTEWTLIGTPGWAAGIWHVSEPVTIIPDSWIQIANQMMKNMLVSNKAYQMKYIASSDEDNYIDHMFVIATNMMVHDGICRPFLSGCGCPWVSDAGYLIVTRASLIASSRSGISQSGWVSADLWMHALVGPEGAQRNV